ncbi:hypothetical protein [Actinomadura rubrisoli]|uniref:Uncharacterized protein n=1 Tax=Actinomadura rubrisoli TaxID=2530368 RepID=A0A4R5C9C2_9ACTN|nr:hypothetical protein [Actinomadura rubrisoli]TDD95825.1 hypothetical protein E1298_04060 [Actinomadura rubrisoli]
MIRSQQRFHLGPQVRELVQHVIGRERRLWELHRHVIDHWLQRLTVRNQQLQELPPLHGTTLREPNRITGGQRRPRQKAAKLLLT